MIVCRLWGGLGNQLFQYAFAYTVAKNTGQNLMLDVSFFEKQTLRGYKLNQFNIKENEIIDIDEIPKRIISMKNKGINKLIRIFPDFFLQVYPQWWYLKETRYKYKHVNYDRLKKHNVYLDGYWQCEKYFAELREDLIEQFQLTKDLSNQAKAIKNRINTTKSVSVHIRRGDYTKIRYSRHLYLLEKEYFYKALDEINQIVNNPTIFFFSDDIEWVKKEFGINSQYEFIQLTGENADLEEFTLMRQCNHNIISNSTFSWWAAWLNTNSNKIIISPERYFGNRDIIPQEWLKIK